MASSPITSWQTNRETMEAVNKLYFLVPQKSQWTLTAAMKLKDTCSLEEKLKNLDNIFKSRDITLQTKVPILKAMVFPVVMYGCVSWTIKKAEQ